MRNRIRDFLILILTIMLAGSVLAVENMGANAPPRQAKATVITVEGMIDDGLYFSIRRRSEEAIARGSDYLIYTIETYGGLVDAADNISKYLILELDERVRTVAFVTTEAISAGAMVSVSCQDIVMRRNTTIGAAAPITMGGQLEGVEREKIESFVRSIFDRAAEANDYPPALLRAMVTMRIEVYRVRNLETGEYAFFTGDELPQDEEVWALDERELVVSDQDILTLTSSRAVEYGVARAEVENLAGVLEFLAERDGVVFADEVPVLEPLWSEQMVRWLNSPAVMGILIMLAILGVYLELSTPGVGLPGLVAVICGTIIIGSKYLMGLATWVELAILGMGIILILIEIFVIPGFGVAGILGIIMIIAGIFGMLVRNPPGEIPWPETDFEWELFSDAALGLIIGVVGFLVAAWVISRYLPRTKWGGKLILKPSFSEEEGAVELESEAGGTEISVGDRGRVASTLRPAGTAWFDDNLMDVVAIGEFIQEGALVEIVEIHGNRIVVRAIPEKED